MKELTFEQLPHAVSQLFEKLTTIEELLLKQEITPTPDTDKILSVPLAAEFLNLSISAIYGLVQGKKIPVSKRGRHLYFSKQELTNWVKEGRKLTKGELDRVAEVYVSRLKRGGTHGN